MLKDSLSQFKASNSQWEGHLEYSRELNQSLFTCHCPGTEGKIRILKRQVMTHETFSSLPVLAPPSIIVKKVLLFA